jgi:hypothetical protein
LALALAACDDNNMSGLDFSGVVLSDMKLGDAMDLAIANVYCKQTCMAPQACCIVGDSAMCVTASQCPDGGVFTACTGPSDCSGGTPNCCVTINLTGDMDAGISASGGGAACTASCPGGLDSNNTNFHTKLCHTAADCAGYMGDFGFGNEVFDGCCNSPRAPLSFCAPSKYAPQAYSCN